MFTDNQVGFSVAAYDSDWTAALDAGTAATSAMFLAHGVVIDVAHHVHDLAGDLFAAVARGLVFVCALVLVGHGDCDR